MPEKIVAGSPALGLDGVEDEAAYALLVPFQRGATVGWGDAGIDDDVGRGREVTDLPAMDRSVVLQRAAPEGRRIDARHPARDDDAVFFHLRLDWRFHELRLADGAPRTKVSCVRSLRLSIRRR